MLVNLLDKIMTCYKHQERTAPVSKMTSILTYTSVLWFSNCIKIYTYIGKVLLKSRIYGFTQIRQLIYFHILAKQLDKVLGGSSKNGGTLLLH